MPPNDPSLPLLVVFGLDFTLWPFWTDGGSKITPPFHKVSRDLVIDRYGKPVTFYEQVPQIFKELRDKGVKIAVTSITTNPHLSRQLLKFFEWYDFLTYVEIFHTPHKCDHFERLRERSGVHYYDMLFFDDSVKHIWDISKLGILSIYVNKGGMNMDELRKGLRHFKNHKNGIHTYTTP